MPLVSPVLDNRRFNDLLAEARSLIPRYAPEWTDHNESDPGITLTQLFAWMTELIIYRLNQVPDLNYIKFLQLLGLELNPAQPARADLTFTLAREDVPTVIVSNGTQVAVAGGDSGSPIIFETDESLVAITAKLAAVQSFDGFSYSLETTRDATVGQNYYPFGPKARAESALMLGFSSALPFPSDQINLAVRVFTEGLKREGTHCEIDLSSMPLPAAVAWEYWDGSFWQPASPDKDETRSFVRSGHIYLRVPGARVAKAVIGIPTEALYWIRVRLTGATYEVVPRLETIQINTVTATQAQTARDEVLGGSDGTPGQVFPISGKPVIARETIEIVTGADGLQVQVLSVRVEADEGSGFLAWQEVTDFFASGPDDPHFVVNRTTGEVRFGDGEHGRIPVANLTNPTGNIVAREYRYGGGSKGNAGAGTITELQTFAEGVKEVTNIRSAYGGSDEESLDNAKLRAPLELKSKDRAVTAEDFEFLATETPGVRVRRAKALPLTHPTFGSPTPGVVTVVAVPESEAPNPTPNEATLQIVCAHLNQHRLLTSEVYVVPPTYRLVRIEAEIVVKREDDLAETKLGIEQQLTNYFHPLTGGDTGTGWEFGRDIFYSEVYRVILNSPGVDRISNNQLDIWVDNERQPFCRDVTIDDGVLLYSDGHDIRVAYSTRQ